MTPVGALQTWLAKPVADKRRSLRYHLRRAWNRLLPRLPVPLRLDPGIWWIARNDAVSDDLWQGTFELPERAFVQRVLRPGMTVLDVGAHAGFYTLLASACVGDAGRVIAFEPSPRERAHLRGHLRLNRRANVTVEEVAIGDAAGSGALFVFDGRTTGCNSFHLADVRGATPITVPIRTLDDYYARGAFQRVDLVKMDIDGAELAALRGAEQMFRALRPLLLCELHDKRTAPWDYPARHIVDLVEGWDYRWLAFDDESGRLVPVAPSQTSFVTNGVAIPNERRDLLDG